MLDLTKNTNLSALYCGGNAILMRKLEVSSSVKTVYCSPQGIIGKKGNDGQYYLPCNGTANLRSERFINGVKGTITRKNKQGQEIKSPSGEEWFFRFNESFIGQEIYCEIKNPSLPNWKVYRSNVVKITGAKKAVALSNTDQEFVFNGKTETTIASTNSSKEKLSQKEIGLRVYPIPANSWINVEVENSDVQFSRYEIVNLSGARISTGKVEGSKTEININDLRKGMYFIRMQGQNHIETVKFSVN